MSIADNLKRINENIAAAASKSKRKPSDIMLVAVTKTIAAALLQDEMQTLKNGNVQGFGENRVQELQEKQALLGSDVKWHMIGHLQRNKVKHVVGKTVLIHSVDSLKLAEEISRIAVMKHLETDVLIEVNIADEASKHGVSPEVAKELVHQAASLQNITVKGLMTVAPFVANPEDNRFYFKKMKELFEEINADAHGPNLQYLSMGMTNDYEVAIEEGANIIRIGTGIFGER